MDALLTVEPVGFFTLDALRAGWYLIWRQLVRIVPVAVVAGLVGGALTALGMPAVGVIVITLGVAAACIWGLVLVPRLTSRWAETRYRYPLTGHLGVWWGVTWRVVVASLVAAVIFAPPNFVALSLSSAYANSALGMLGHLLTALLGVANSIVTVMATGWAMSRVTAAQLSWLPVAPGSLDAAPVVSQPLPVAPTPTASSAPVAVSQPVALPVSAPASGADGKRQCPKCGLYETERGSVIGWYCTICGWREGRR